MASLFYIAGPTYIQVNAALLGRTDNDNLPSVQFQDPHKEIKTILSGDMPAEVILMGTTAKVAVALVQWDEATLDSLITTQRGNATVGKYATVGRRLVTQTGTFSLSIISVDTGMAFTFPRAYLAVDGVQDSQWGNRERVLTLNFHAIPDEDGDLYIYSGPTSPTP
jgi:hypothetical protein